MNPPHTRQSQQPDDPPDDRKPECPYCHGKLKKVPGSKTKCPTCGRFMYVRTDPETKARRVVTAAEASKIDELWAVVAGTAEQLQEGKAEFENERRILKLRFGKEPSESDVTWGVLNNQLIE